MNDIIRPINPQPAPPPPPAPVLSAALYYAVETGQMSFAGALTESLDFERTYNDRLRTERNALLRLRDDLAAEIEGMRRENARLRERLALAEQAATLVISVLTIAAVVAWIGWAVVWR